MTPKNKLRKVYDKNLIDKAIELEGYIHYVYKFGCRFIHLSNFHNYKTTNPFNKLNETENSDVKKYLSQYHSYPLNQELSFENLRDYIPNIFEKISSNLTCYFDQILNDGTIVM